MKKILSLSFATGFLLIALSFRPVLINNERLIDKINLADKSEDTHLIVQEANYILIPPCASSYMPQEIPARAQICFEVGQVIENFLQKKTDENLKSIVQDIDMHNLDK